MNNPRERITVREKMSIFILIILTLFVVALGAWQIKDTIFSPFERNPSGETDSIFDESQNIDELRRKDTDQDGLSDFDELYVHGTSPYLPDSDSDGLSDSAEIAMGKDANCPEGQDCYTQTASSADEDEADSAEETDLSAQEKADLVMDLAPDELRAILVQAGVPQETLDQLSDEDLQKLVSQILSEEMGGTATSTQE
ncbi:hypothetical protein KJ969_02325 [Patescibacteria group bacterium]|nr:hypothetical protein [Patescibacteria group bacterium]MBU1922300.1 hypothetical protein [Patescibacteria group bacterium]